MGLDTQQQILIEQRVGNDSRSALVAYLLLIFAGGLGIHRFYLGHTGSGVAMLVLLIVGVLTTPIVIGFVLLLALGIWWIVDLFLIPGMVNRQRDELRRNLQAEYLARHPAA